MRLRLTLSTVPPLRRFPPVPLEVRSSGVRWAVELSMVCRYLLGESLRELAAASGLTHAGVAYVLGRYGVPMRKRGHSSPIRPGGVTRRGNRPL
jgi:hypothetical protein